ncbi:Zinc finger, CCHC-type [Rhizoctonia solani]|uniref:Zinc finger, CCHC-type n=1 Tax=Rhizoctonia solani TaxID=456999 RepID=A0A8H8NTT0_9AGAM|nr:Zinc finger, CCHC-type [Rhizoctonia solani]QRW18203.1 Zinc finger, CCHC-type [Rhizoctonia solani]
MSFSQMSDCEVLDMVAQNMIILKKEFLQLQGAYKAQHDQIALLRAELEEHRNQSRNQHIFYSTQIQGAAASIQAVQDQLLHNSTTRPTAPPPPSGTATSTNPPPAPASSNSDLKFAKPNKFSGKKEDALNFIIACQAYIRAKGASRSHKEKILKEGFQGRSGPLLEDIDVFWAEFTKHYVDTNRDEKYRQNGTTCGRRLRDETLRNKYYDGLQNNIKDIMLSTMFQWRRATAQQVYDKAEEIANHIESTRYLILLSLQSAPLPMPPHYHFHSPFHPHSSQCAITSIVRNYLWQYAKCCWNGESKDTMIPFPSLKRMSVLQQPPQLNQLLPLSSVSHKQGSRPQDLDGRGFANLTCHVCGGKGHFARNCPSKPMSGHVANVKWSWERPKEENRIEVVSDEEESGKGKAKAN